MKKILALLALALVVALGGATIFAGLPHREPARSGGYMRHVHLA